MVQISEYFNSYIYVTVSLTVCFVLCEQEDVIDLYDLLEEDLMPGNLLVLENIEKYDKVNESFIEIPNNMRVGDKDEAIWTMGFHRKMMNEYLCRNYISEQIMTGMSLVRTKRRLDNTSDIPSSIIGMDRIDKLLNDEGSTNYKEWLKRSATLEDIYRQFEKSDHTDQESTEGENENRKQGGLGDYAGISSLNGHNKIPPQTEESAAKAGYIHEGGLTYGGGHDNHVGFGYEPPAPVYEDIAYEEHHQYQPKYYEKNKKKEELTQLFEIALTALAYLSFGMFLIHVLMCISMTGTSTNMTTIMPMQMPSMSPMPGRRGSGEPSGAGPTDTGDGITATGSGPGISAGTGTGTGIGSGTGNGGDDDGGASGTGGDGTGMGDDDDTEIITSEDGDDIRFRFKRNVNGFLGTSFLNELARKILVTVDSALLAKTDNGECLRRSICENNKYSRSLETNEKYWIPVWSLGMSWLSGRLVPGVPKSASMLESLKASMLGLGKADCEFIYRNCNLQLLRESLVK